MPRSPLSSGSPRSPRSECQSASEPCGSASMTRHLRPSRWAAAARCAVSVVLPAPPLREASVMTFMAGLPDRSWADVTASLRQPWLTNGYEAQRPRYNGPKVRCPGTTRRHERDFPDKLHGHSRSTVLLKTQKFTIADIYVPVKRRKTLDPNTVA